MKPSLQRALLTSLIAFIGLIAATSISRGAESVSPPVSTRFDQPKSQEVPDFQRHVIPLLGRLGCNGRECHGSFQGRGGFRLSLFGAEFATDHAALTDDQFGRVDLDDVAESMLLQKPTLAADHEGGKRFAADGWEYRLLHSWINAGAKPTAEDAPQLSQLIVEPSELVFGKNNAKKPLRVIAHWSNGDREDVTPLCRFQSNNESVVTVSDAGVASANGRGDSHIIVYYENGIAAVPVVRPLSDAIAKSYPKTAEPTPIDQLIGAKLRKLGVAPSEISGDAEFLRRVSLDLTSTLPAPAETEAFLADDSPDKRARKVNELLERPTYAASMTLLLADLTGLSTQNLPVGGEQALNNQKAQLWYDWMHRRVKENVGYDEIVAGIVLARSRDPDQSEADYYQQMTSFFREENQADFSEQPSMPFFWTRGRFTPPQTLRFSYAFLGVRLECAECHKHPFDQWTQADYQDFQIFFNEVRFRQSGKRGLAKEMKTELGLTADQDSGGYKRLFAKLAHEGVVTPWGEVTAANWTKRKPRPPRNQPAGRVITPRLLGGEELIANQFSDPREPLMQWLRDESNPYFARSIVNRVWARCFGVGIVDPPDDMNLANPASNEPLLAWLADEFIRSDYDLKQLHRTIAASNAYQRTWRPSESNRHDETNFSRAIIRRMPAETLYDAIAFASATADEQRLMQTDADTVRGRKIGFPESSSKAPGTYALNLFGKPPRKVLCDCERTNEPTLLQTMYLRNDEELFKLLGRKTGWLAELKRQDEATLGKRSNELIRQAWLRTLGRPPRDEEITAAKQHFESSEDTQSAMRDLVWALVNCQEFIVNH